MTAEGRGDRARRTMIDAAERLIAERGLGAAVAAGGRRGGRSAEPLGGPVPLRVPGGPGRGGLRRQDESDRRSPGRGAGRARRGRGHHRSRRSDRGRGAALAEAIVVDPPGWYGRFLAEIARSEPSLLAGRPAGDGHPAPSGPAHDRRHGGGTRQCCGPSACGWRWVLPSRCWPTGSVSSGRSSVDGIGPAGRPVRRPCLHQPRRRPRARHGVGRRRRPALEAELAATDLLD